MSIDRFTAMGKGWNPVLCGAVRIFARWRPIAPPNWPMLTRFLKAFACIDFHRRNTFRLQVQQLEETCVSKCRTILLVVAHHYLFWYCYHSQRNGKGDLDVVVWLSWYIGGAIFYSYAFGQWVKLELLASVNVCLGAIRAMPEKSPHLRCSICSVQPRTAPYADTRLFSVEQLKLPHCH